jgi:NhaA family Na+:H+ antiporter
MSTAGATDVESPSLVQKELDLLATWTKEQELKGERVAKKLREAAARARKKKNINHVFRQETIEFRPQDSEDRLPPAFWRNKHVFAELDELHKGEWKHTHRWNYGLEELYTGNENRSSETSPTLLWGEPRIPQVSILGLHTILERLKPANVMLNVPGFTFQEVVENVVERAVKRRLLPGFSKDKTIATILGSTRRALGLGKKKSEERNSSEISSAKTNETEETAEPVSEVDPDSTNFLSQDVGEEALLIKVGECDAMRWKDNSEDASMHDHNLLVFVRMLYAIDVGISGASTSTRGAVDRDSVKDARFFVLILGPNRPRTRKLNLEVGCSFAALLQDENVCAAAYNADDPAQFIEEFEHHLHHIKVVPDIHRPTVKGVTKRKMRLGRALSSLAQTSTQWAKWEARQNVKFTCNSLSNTLEFAQTYAIPLLLGIFIALIWANIDATSFKYWLGGHSSDTGGSTTSVNGTAHSRVLLSVTEHNPTLFGLSILNHSVTIHFIVNDILMCFFFGLAVKEITEAVSPGGSMYPPKEKAINPLLGTIGGVFGPIIVYFIMIAVFAGVNGLPNNASFADVAIGWGIPTATDISLAWVTSLMCFGPGHPAILYLLLLAVVDDGIGLIIIAIFYSDKSVRPELEYLLLALLAMLVAYSMRRGNVQSWQLYVFIAGPLAWCGLLKASLHPALALVFVVPFMPLHAVQKEDGEESAGDDGEATAVKPHHLEGPLHQFEHAVKPFVDIFVLFSFGLVNAGVQFNYFGSLSFIILLSLMVGKTLGVGMMSLLGGKIGYPPPPGIGVKEAFMVGFIASLGLTVALFVAGVAFPDSPRLEGEAKMGALLSIFVAAVAIIISKTCIKFEVPTFAVKRESKGGLNIDLDSDSDDEEMGIAMVRAMKKTIQRVDHSIKHTEKVAGSSREEAYKRASIHDPHLKRHNSISPTKKSVQFENGKIITPPEEN